MSISSQEIHDSVKEFILREFLPGESPDELKDDTPLISGGIIDSIATLKLVAFVEDTWGIELEAHEADAENLDTIDQVVRLVQAKL